MNHYIYVFGSICRGEVAFNSDVDLLAIVDGLDNRFDPRTYSIYSRQRLAAIWTEGNPFAWHLAKESRLVFTPDGTDFLGDLGEPGRYKNAATDCEKFHVLFKDALDSFASSSETRVFDLSTMFLSIRNFATCFLLGVLGQPCFSRDSAIKMGDRSAPLSKSTYDLLLRARLLSTRAIGAPIAEESCPDRLTELQLVDDWMMRLRNDGFTRNRVQQSNVSPKTLDSCRQ